MATISDFEDTNPFQTDTVDASSEAGSDVNLSVPSSPQTHPARILSPPATPSLIVATARAPFKPPQPAASTDPCCARDRWIHSGEDVEIQIVDAQKTSEHASSPYIAYVIKAGNATSFHRYSDFESLRNSLAKLYPTLIIPPIPSKQSIGDYAVKQGKAKEDVAMIARRKRTLQTFLNRVARHPILSQEHVFHRFLDGEVSWSEVLHSPPLSLLPKNILKAPAHNPTDSNASLAYAALPSPSSSHPLRRPDQHFLDSEAFTNKFASHVSGPMEKVTRRTLKRWGEYAQDHADLGAVLNGFSLNETGQLATSLEKTGQAIDATYMSTTQLAQELEQNWSEPLHEYGQFASIIKKLLAFRHQKHAQVELTQDQLDQKRAQLDDLERNEREASRLEEALGRGRPASSLRPGTRSASANGGVASGAGSGNGDMGVDSGQVTAVDSGVDVEQNHISPSIYTHTPPPPVRRSASAGMGFLNALSYTLHGMMDVDPEIARRSGISKTRETISQLEDALHLAAQDLKYASSTIQADLDRFQRQKVADLREMALAMARSHRDWCKKNLEAWEEAKKEIALIPDHPNRLPEAEVESVAEGSKPMPGPADLSLRRHTGLR